MKLFYSTLKTSFVLALINFSFNAYSQTLLYQETFPNQMLQQTAPDHVGYSGDLGVWVVNSLDATGKFTVAGAVDGPEAISAPYSMILVNDPNNTGGFAQIEFASPSMDLSGVAGNPNINLGFWINTAGLDPTDACNLYVVQFYNGTTFHSPWSMTSADLVAAYGNSGWHQVAINIPTTDLTSTFNVFFDGNNPNGCGTTTQTLKIDNVQIFNGTIPLPVNLLSFNATYNNNIATLNWKVEESNILTYTIERSSDGRSFLPLTSIKAQNRGAVTDYSYTDNLSTYNNSNVFYRLAIQEATGYRHYSDILNLKLKLNGLSGMLSPNPAQSYVNMSLVSNSNSTAIIEIYNIAGQKSLEQRVSLAKGMNTIQLNKLNQLPKGMYLIKTITDGKIQTSKLIIN